jgi:hypothetical protein
MDSMVKTAGTNKGLNQRVLEFLQSQKYTQLVDELDTVALKSRLGLGAVVLTLLRLFLDRMRERLVSLLPAEDSNAVTDPESITGMKLQVNRFVGYGLFKLIERAKCQLDKDAAEDDDDELLRELEFVRSMRIFHNEAMSIPSYASDCYDMTQALGNNGHLALLAPAYFDFGTQVMTAVSRTFTQNAFLKHGNECLSEGKKAIRKLLPTLEQLFIDSCGSEQHVNILSSRKREMVAFIVERTIHAFYGMEEKTCRELKTGRKGTDHTANSFRSHLSSICLTGVVADKKALAKAEEGRKRKR